MSKVQEMCTLESAFKYVKSNRSFFRKFFYYYKLTNNVVFKFITVISMLLILAGIALFIFKLFSEPNNLPSYELVIIGFVLYLPSGFFSSKMNKLYVKEYEGQHYKKVYESLNGLSDVYYTPKRLKKMLKFMRSGKADSIKSAAAALQLKKTDHIVDLNLYNQDVQNASEEYKKQLEEKAKKQARQEAEDKLVGSLGLGLLCGTAVLISTPIKALFRSDRESFENSSAGSFLRENREALRRGMEQHNAKVAKREALLKEADM